MLVVFYYNFRPFYWVVEATADQLKLLISQSHVSSSVSLSGNVCRTEHVWKYCHATWGKTGKNALRNKCVQEKAWSMVQGSEEYSPGGKKSKPCVSRVTATWHTSLGSFAEGSWAEPKNRPRRKWRRQRRRRGEKINLEALLSTRGPAEKSKLRL